MTDDPTAELIEQLDNLLEDERRALLAGDLEAIGRLLRRKEALIDALNDIPPQAADGLEALQGKVVRNQALLDGALQGIRKVAGRMAAFRRIRRGLDTYDAEGRRTTIPGEIDHKVEKRA
jgi:hypothetical protein